MCEVTVAQLLRLIMGKERFLNNAECSAFSLRQLVATSKYKTLQLNRVVFFVVGHCRPTA